MWNVCMLRLRITSESRLQSHRGENGHLLYRRMVNKDPFKRFIPHVLNLMQMRENHWEVFLIGIKSVQMFEPTVVYQKNKVFCSFILKEIFQLFPGCRLLKKYLAVGSIHSKVSIQSWKTGCRPLSFTLCLFALTTELLRYSWSVIISRA